MKKTNIGTTLVTAAALGVAAGVATVALSNKKNRKAAGKIVGDLSNRAHKFADEVKKDPRVKKALRQGLSVANDASIKARPMAKKVVKRAKSEAKKKLN